MAKKKRKKIKKRYIVYIILVVFIVRNCLSNIHFDNKGNHSVQYLFSGSIKKRLEYLVKEDERIQGIIDHYDDYPEELLDSLATNIEMLDYVLDFPNNRGSILGEDVGNISKNEIPLLLQWDKRWGYAEYGDNYLAISGCGPTALSMVIVGLTQNTKVTPAVVAKYAKEKGYANQYGTSWSLMTQGSREFNVTGTEITLSKSIIYDYLEQGNPIICSMGPGDFTTQGHFIVLTSIVNGKIKLNDPNSKLRSNRLWDYDVIEGQIKNLWVFRRI